MGAAGIGLALWKYAMNFNPANPDWLARDRTSLSCPLSAGHHLSTGLFCRPGFDHQLTCIFLLPCSGFVLSAGHACLLQYIYLHLSGYSAWTVDQLKAYHSPSALADGTIAAGHPEIEFPGVEVTTGPLGQGIANAVGLAIAGKQIAAQYDREGFAIAGDAKVFCFTGDGCLQEGVGQEAISLAGHLGLDNLILIYDNNRITVDGNIDTCFTDDTSAKLRAQNWHIIEVDDGTSNLHSVVDALEAARAVTGKPVLVNIRTIIGFPSNKRASGFVPSLPPLALT
jgi:dihydroxyacetone synthase